MKIIERVYKGRDNANDLKLTADGVAVDLSSVTKMELISIGWSVASDASPGVFDWSQGAGVVSITLGGVSGIPLGSSSVSLIVYDPDNTAGIHWGDFYIYVK